MRDPDHFPEHPMQPGDFILPAPTRHLPLDPGAYLAAAARLARAAKPRVTIDIDVFNPDGERAVQLRWTA